MSETKTTTSKTAGKPSTTTKTTAKIRELENGEEMAVGTSTTIISNNRKLLLKNQLHLNLSVNNNEKIEKIDSEDKKSSKKSVRIPATAESDQEIKAEVVKFKDDVSNLETMTVTTVPQIQKKQQKSIIEATKKITTSISSSVAAASASSSSLLNSSPSALAKFNRIIDSTMPATDCYQQQSDKRNQKDTKQRQQKEYHGIGTTTDSKERRKIDFISSYDDDVALNVEKDNNGDVTKNKDEEEYTVSETVEGIDENDDNQMKRNDVHYLLKQLNSFSDIEEIEIVDMKQRRQQQQQQSHQTATARALAATTPAIATAAVITHSPTTTSLVIISPSSQSHKESRHLMRRFASLHQQRQYPEKNHHHQRLQHENRMPQYQHSQRYYTLNASGGNLLELGDRIERGLDPAMEQQYLLQQFDDYLFESCHYLETNYFAATYRTAMIESSSHEFRPSTTTGTRSSPSAASCSPRSFEIHEVELPSVICRAPPPPPSPTRRFNMQARLTTSGVQTELTASSLSSTTTTTTTSHDAQAQAFVHSDGSSGVSACSYASSTEQRRRMPFFKCCYAPIGRWREKRSAAATIADCSARVDSTSNGASTSHKARSGSDRDTSKAEASHGGGSQRQSKSKQKQRLHARKSGSAV